MKCRGNRMYRAKGSLTETHNFSDTLRNIGPKFLKRNSIYCTKCNEINMCHLDSQKYVSNDLNIV